MIGQCCVKHWSKTQSTISLSSGEAELHGITQGAAQALGVKSLMADMGWSININLHSDATAAIGIARRKGLGKIRHLDTADLWIQDQIRKGDFALVKVAGADNPADILTKNVDKPLLLKHMETLGLSVQEGRAESAPAIAE